MRTIKFRGKCLDNGEWVYGSLICGEGIEGAYILTDDARCFEDLTDVDPGTVGQLTGVLDKNGKEIYEGDIVRTLSGFVGYMRYNERFIRFEVASNEESYDNDRNPDGVPRESWEALGNIYDNTELLKQND